MDRYIGTKEIYAAPMTQGEFLMSRGEAVEPATAKLAGYKVVYPGGDGQDDYVAWSPKDAFEAAYQRTDEGMSFGAAVFALKRKLAKKLARKGWNGKGIFIGLQVPDENSANTLPYLFIDTRELETDNPDAPKGRVPWRASQTDMLSDDWVIVG